MRYNARQYRKALYLKSAGYNDDEIAEMLSADDYRRILSTFMEDAPSKDEMSEAVAIEDEFDPETGLNIHIGAAVLPVIAVTVLFLALFLLFPHPALLLIGAVANVLTTGIAINKRKKQCKLKGASNVTQPLHI